MKSLFNLVLLLLATLSASTQSMPYWIFLADKADSRFNPYEYFDTHTIERRLAQGIPVNQFSDWPVTNDYIDLLDEVCDTLGFASRWLNAVAVKCSPELAETILSWPFVTEVVPMLYGFVPASAGYDSTISTSVRKRMKQQLDAMGLSRLQEKGLDGKGIRIAIFDAGFNGADISPAFQHIRDRGGVLKTWDFKKNSEFVYHGHSHGTMVWSCIAGKWDDAQSGLATGADFLLARTEGKGEPFEEEINWIAALEWADKNGADIISSSLGYTFHRYFPEQMNGRTAPVSRAASLAAQKGILVVNAAGNEGLGSWRTIVAPADADSVLTVGGITPETGYHTGFSSYGPSTDGRLKPNVSAFAWVGVAGKNKWTLSQGTSFACPLVAGFAACTWQYFPDSSNMAIFNIIQKSGSLYPYFDYAHGYGIPQSGRILGDWDADTIVKSIYVTKGSDVVSIQVIESANRQIEFPGDDYLYCHLRGANGLIKKYYVVMPEKDKNFDIPLSELSIGDVLMCYYRGFSSEYKF